MRSGTPTPNAGKSRLFLRPFRSRWWPRFFFNERLQSRTSNLLIVLFVRSVLGILLRGSVFSTKLVFTDNKPGYTTGITLEDNVCTRVLRALTAILCCSSNPQTKTSSSSTRSSSNCQWGSLLILKSCQIIIPQSCTGQSARA